MTQRELAATITSHMIALLAAIGLVAIIALAQHKDEADDSKARAQVEQQARAAAQPDTWARLDHQSKEMVNYEGIKKK
jgi:hypothetical protein